MIIHHHIENISLIKNTTLLINKNIKEEKLKIFNESNQRLNIIQN